MKNNKNITLVAKIFNSRYGLLYWDSYELPNTLYSLAQSVDLPCGEFENTELEYEIYNLFYNTYVDDIVDRFDWISFNWFLPIEHTKIALSFNGVGGSDYETCFEVDTKLDSKTEIDRLIKEIKELEQLV